MIWAKRFLLATIITGLLLNLGGCLGKSKKPDLYFIRKGEESPIDGVVITREDLWRVIQRVKE